MHYDQMYFYHAVIDSYQFLTDGLVGDYHGLPGTMCIEVIHLRLFHLTGSRDLPPQVSGMVCPEPTCRLPLDDTAVAALLGTLERGFGGWPAVDAGRGTIMYHIPTPPVVPPQKVFRPSKPIPNTFSEGTWRRRECEDVICYMAYHTFYPIVHGVPYLQLHGWGICMKLAIPVLWMLWAPTAHHQSEGGGILVMDVALCG